MPTGSQETACATLSPPHGQWLPTVKLSVKRRLNLLLSTSSRSMETAVTFRELGMHFTIIPVSYQQALLAYLGDPKGLNGVITTARYGPSSARRLIPLRP